MVQTQRPSVVYKRERLVSGLRFDIYLILKYVVIVMRIRADSLLIHTYSWIIWEIILEIKKISKNWYFRNWNVIHRNAMFWFEICTIWTVIPVVNRKNWCESMPNIFRTENRLLQEWCEKRKYFWEQLEKWDFLKTEQSDWLQCSVVQSTMSDFWLFYLVLHNFNKTFL